MPRAEAADACLRYRRKTGSAIAGQVRLLENSVLNQYVLHKIYSGLALSDCWEYFYHQLPVYHDSLVKMKFGTIILLTHLGTSVNPSLYFEVFLFFDVNPSVNIIFMCILIWF